VNGEPSGSKPIEGDRGRFVSQEISIHMVAGLLPYKEVYELRIPEGFNRKIMRTETEAKVFAERQFQSDKRRFLLLSAATNSPHV